MGIQTVKYENVRSIKNCYLTFSELNILLGRNGSGKTNLQKYLNYFFENLTTNTILTDIFDKENPYNDYAKISVQYDLSNFIHSSDLEHEIFKKISCELDEGKTITLTLTQFKNNEIIWSHSYEIRKIIKYLFPIYFIDVRNIDLLDWENIWDLIGDLGQKRSLHEDTISFELNTLLKKIYGGKYIDNLLQLQNELKDYGYGVIPYNNSDKFKQLYKFIFGGENFNYKDNRLDFYSNGSNSFNYIRIFYLVLNLLHKDKFKHPLVILDEPEIGLHPTLIDELVNFISLNEARVQTLLSTHSSRVVKNSMSLSKVNIFQLIQQKNSTIIKKVKAFEDSRLNKVITDKEASYYFSSGILFVEGITEYELFTSRVLKEIFPVLKRIEIFSYDSNNTTLDISHPHRRKMNIPHLLLLDSDKILNFRDSTRNFTITGDIYNPLKNQKIIQEEMFHYGYKRKLRIVRNRINGISSKTKFNINESTFTFDDDLYRTFRTLVKNYCKYYNVYPVETTIEGVLINKENYTFFISWITSDYSRYSQKDKLKELIEKSGSVRYKVNILRTIVEGKLDTLVQLNSAHISSLPDNAMKNGYIDALNLQKVKKGSGWVVEFIEYVYNNLNEKEKEKQFSLLFPELTDIIKKLEFVME
ncbi:retron Eco8 family effector endonuclease [Exiguobacterium sp. S3]|uniref:retron Eco8 family effector endonuclease n=1 Tax=unclassified Exiguobacterium TaxID=2644629 RepID=UPI001BEAD01C